MLGSTPSELVFGGVYYPPGLVIPLLALVVTWFVAKFLNRTRLARFFWYPSLAFVAMWALFSAIIGLLFLAP